MGKYGASQSSNTPRQAEIHPVWRGIGCLILVLMPIIAYTAADVFVTMNGQYQWVPLPGEYYVPLGMQYIRIEDANFVYGINFGGLKMGVAVLTGIFLFLELGLYSLLYAIFYKITAPPLYGPTDAPELGRYRDNRRSSRR